MWQSRTDIPVKNRYYEIPVKDRYPVKERHSSQGQICQSRTDMSVKDRYSHQGQIFQSRTDIPVKNRYSMQLEHRRI
jgi:hypothetical protein